MPARSWSRIARNRRARRLALITSQPLPGRHACLAFDRRPATGRRDLDSSAAADVEFASEDPAVRSWQAFSTPGGQTCRAVVEPYRRSVTTGYRVSNAHVVCDGPSARGHIQPDVASTCGRYPRPCVRQEEVAGDPNWVHPVTTFRDVVDILRATLHLTGPLRRRALEANLKWEIIENTRELLHRTEKGIGVKARWLPKDQLPLAPSRVREVRIDYPGTFWLFQFRMSLPRMATLSRSALEEGINSGLFLDYEPVTSVQVVGSMQRTLLDLRLQMVRLEGLVDSINSDDAIRRDVARCVEAAKVERGTNVSDMTVAFLHAARDAMDNVLRLNRALYCHLEGLEPTLERPDLLPTSPYGSVPAEKREDPNRRETVTWLRLTGWPEATDRRSATEAGLRAIDDPEIVRRLDEMEDRGESGV